VARIDIVFQSCVPDEQAVKSGCRSEAATHVVEFQSLDTATEVADPFIASFEFLKRHL
jgi:hypothetical protein